MGGCNDGTKPWHGVLPMLASGRFQQMVAAGGTPAPAPPPKATEGTSEQERQALKKQAPPQMLPPLSKKNLRTGEYQSERCFL